MKADERDQLIRAMFEEDMKLLQAKGHDYAGQEDALANLRKWGLLGIIIRLGDKMSRLESFAQAGRLEVAESIEDTLRDMSNYCYLARLFLPGKDTRP